MDSSVIDLTIYQLLAAYAFIVMLLIIVRLRKIPRERIILISTLRMTIQLVLVGYLLVYMFDNPHPLLTLLIIFLMELFAIYNIIKRSKGPLSRSLKRAIAISITIGTLTCLFYFLLVVVNVNPWYEPRYFIPIAGMLIGNAMTGITLGVNRLTSGIKSQKALIESSLMLGATPKAAVRHLTNEAFDAAILPSINSMLGMGIVFLPGMMTGQILSGTSPTTAIAYQIAIMLGILGSVSLTLIIFIQLATKSFFNKDAQLMID